MLENGLDIFSNEGCLLCEYCTIMHDLTRELSKNDRCTETDSLSNENDSEI